MAKTKNPATGAGAGFLARLWVLPYEPPHLRIMTTRPTPTPHTMAGEDTKRMISRRTNASSPGNIPEDRAELQWRAIDNMRYPQCSPAVKRKPHVRPTATAERAAGATELMHRSAVRLTGGSFC